jgi:hypothetical protein
MERERQLSPPKGRDEGVIVVRATRRLLGRLSAGRADQGEASTTVLGDWYATLLPWRPRLVALFVSEQTLLPVLVPLAPAVSVLNRFPAQLGDVLAGSGAADASLEAEVAGSKSVLATTTTSRSVLGSMNEFAFLADQHRHGDRELDLLHLSVLLARTPCGPLFARHVSPDRESLAHLATSRTPS